MLIPETATLGGGGTSSPPHMRKLHPRARRRQGRHWNVRQPFCRMKSTEAYSSHPQVLEPVSPGLKNSLKPRLDCPKDRHLVVENRKMSKARTTQSAPTITSGDGRKNPRNILQEEGGRNVPTPVLIQPKARTSPGAGKTTQENSSPPPQ